MLLLLLSGFQVTLEFARLLEVVFGLIAFLGISLGDSGLSAEDGLGEGSLPRLVPRLTSLDRALPMLLALVVVGGGVSYNLEFWSLIIVYELATFPCISLSLSEDLEMFGAWLNNAIAVRIS